MELEAVAAGARTKKPFYHASINTGVDERLTINSGHKLFDRLEEAPRPYGAASCRGCHEKKGASTVTRPGAASTWRDARDQRTATITASTKLSRRSLEREFGHERVQGAHVERDGRRAAKANSSHAEMLQPSALASAPSMSKNT